MKSAQPPALATWVLKRFGPRNEPLIGDLAERFFHRRSSSWYWRQVWWAILIEAGRDFREHKLLAVRAVAIGWAVLIPWFYFTVAMYRSANPWMAVWIPGAWFHGSFMSRMLWWAWWIYAAPLLVAWCVCALSIGWALARLHRDYRAAIVFSCIASQLPFTAIWAWPAWHNAHGPLVNTAYSVPNQVFAVLTLVAVPICTFLGALWGADDVAGPNTASVVAFGTQNE